MTVPTEVMEHVSNVLETLRNRHVENVPHDPLGLLSVTSSIARIDTNNAESSVSRPRIKAFTASQGCATLANGSTVGATTPSMSVTKRLTGSCSIVVWPPLGQATVSRSIELAVPSPNTRRLSLLLM